MEKGFIVQQKSSAQEIIAVYDNQEKLIDVFVQRTRMLNIGEVIEAKILSFNKTLRGYFVQTSKNLPAFIPSKEKYNQGESVLIEVIKEARLGKDATGRFTSKDIYLPNLMEQVQKKYPFCISKKSRKLSTDIEEALEKKIVLADNAALWIERTNALWTIDVDSGKSGQPLFELNKQAVEIIYQQIQLKNMSGMILVDFAGSKSQEEKKSLLKMIKNIFAGDERTKIYDFTKMNLLEIKRGRTSSSLFDLFYKADGLKKADYVNLLIKEALDSLKGGRVVLEIHPSQLSFLEEEVKTNVQIKTNLNVQPDFFDLKEK